MKTRGIVLLMIAFLILVAPWLATLALGGVIYVGWCYFFYGKLMGAKRWWIPLLLPAALGIIIVVVSVLGAFLNWIF
jgi:hypothetical protein